jgi:hypothetical protein
MRTDDLWRAFHDLSRVLDRELYQIAEHAGRSDIVLHAIERLAKETAEAHRMKASKVGPFRAGQLKAVPSKRGRNA